MLTGTLRGLLVNVGAGIANGYADGDVAATMLREVRLTVGADKGYDARLRHGMPRDERHAACGGHSPPCSTAITRQASGVASAPSNALLVKGDRADLTGHGATLGR
ncbi:MAG: hypothetical protein HIU89_04455 [Proteobacteria bacterium]|nr:hypothetical protein [Pseudomonadota bacterium]